MSPDANTAVAAPALQQPLVAVVEAPPAAVPTPSVEAVQPAPLPAPVVPAAPVQAVDQSPAPGIAPQPAAAEPTTRMPIEEQMLSGGVQNPAAHHGLFTKLALKLNIMH